MTIPPCDLTGDLFDGEWEKGEARRRRDAAMAQVEENADDAWKRDALEAVRQVCLRRQHFIVDHVWDFVGKPREARAMGPVMLVAERAGWCRKTGRFEPSSQPQCHANPRRVRESLIWKGNL